MLGIGRWCMRYGYKYSKGGRERTMVSGMVNESVVGKLGTGTGTSAGSISNKGAEIIELTQADVNESPPYPLLPPRVSTGPIPKMMENRNTLYGWIKMGALLGKARLGSVVVATTAVGYCMAPFTFSLSSVLPFIIASTGTAISVLSANAGNQILERDVDGKMMRTRLRLLPTKVLSVQEATAFFVATGIIGPALVYYVDPLAGALALANIAIYVGIYTPLKQRHPINTWVGALVGAIPPLIGWSAATGGHLGIGAWILAALLYFWQMPHFLALSWPLRHDYARGGFKMLSNVAPDRVPNQIVINAAILHLIPILSVYYDLTTPFLLIDSFLINSFFSYVSYRFLLDMTDQSAWKVFRHSIWYIMAMSALFIFHKKSEDPETS